MTKNEALNFLARFPIRDGESTDAIPIARTIITRGDYDLVDKSVDIGVARESIQMALSMDSSDVCAGEVVLKYLNVLDDEGLVSIYLDVLLGMAYIECAKNALR